MFTVTMFLLNIDYTGHLCHEVLGLSLALLFSIHMILNFRWPIQIIKNFKKVKVKSRLMFIIDVAIFISYTITIITGTMIGNEIFRLNLSSLTSMLTHIVTRRLSAILMFIHIGFHLDRIISKIASKKIQKIIYIIYIASTITLASFLSYTLFNSYIWQALRW